MMKLKSKKEKEIMERWMRNQAKKEKSKSPCK